MIIVVLIYRVSGEAEETLSEGTPSDVSSQKYNKLQQNEAITNMLNINLFSTNWGPRGFSKKLHPLSIMVYSFFFND